MYSYMKRVEITLRSVSAETVTARTAFAHTDASVHAFIRSLIRRGWAEGVESTQELSEVLDEWSGPRVAPATAAKMVAEAGWDTVFRAFVSEMGYAPESPEALAEFYLMDLAAAINTVADMAAALADRGPSR